MRKMILILAFVAIASLIASVSYAQDAIEITDAYTMNYCMDEFDVFGIWDPIGFNVECSVSGDPAKTYKVVIIVNAKSLGERIVKKYKRVSPGDTITFKDFRLIGDDDPLGSHTVKFIAKLKKGGVLLDKDTATSEITVQEERPDFTCY